MRANLIISNYVLKNCVSVLYILSLFHVMACEQDTREASHTQQMLVNEMALDSEVADWELDKSTGVEELEFEQTAWLRIGTGFRRYEPLIEGQEVPIIAGIQGGFHVWGGFVGGGFDDTDVRIQYSLELQDTQLAIADYIEFDLPQNYKNEFEYAGVSVIYFNNDDVERTSGLEMVLKVTVITIDGQRLTDQQTLYPQCCE